MGGSDMTVCASMSRSTYDARGVRDTYEVCPSTSRKPGVIPWNLPMWQTALSGEAAPLVSTMEGERESGFRFLSLILRLTSKTLADLSLCRRPLHLLRLGYYWK